MRWLRPDPPLFYVIHSILLEGDRMAKAKGPSLQDSLIFLGKALKIVSDQSEKYYLKGASEVSKETLMEVAISLVQVSNLLARFKFSWIDSKRSGPDAVEVSKSLDERIDIKLVRTGKLDFEQLKKLMTRLNRADDALLGLNRINFYITDYARLCSEKKLKRNAKTVRLFIEGNLNPTIDSINSEIVRSRSQMERCNIYYQNQLKSKTFRIAFISLLVSSVSVLISILPHIIPAILAAFDP